MKRLTIQQAEAEARWRWGNLLVKGYAHHDETLRLPFEIGTVLFGTVTIRGRGASWEGAFTDAARKTNTEAVEARPATVPAPAPAPGRAVRPSSAPARPTFQAHPNFQSRSTAAVRPNSSVQTTAVRVGGLVTTARNPDSRQRA